jgi:hypothetical protein
MRARTCARGTPSADSCSARTSASAARPDRPRGSTGTRRAGGGRDRGAGRCVRTGSGAAMPPRRRRRSSPMRTTSSTPWASSACGSAAHST